MDNTDKRSQPTLQRKSFLITCWQERLGKTGKGAWRFRLETASLSMNKVYPDLHELTGAIQKILDQAEGIAEDDNEN